MLGILQATQEHPVLIRLITVDNIAETHGNSCWITSVYHLPPGFLSLRKDSLSLNCLHRRPYLGTICTRLSLRLVLGLPCRLVNSRCVHAVTLIAHMLHLNRATCPEHPCNPFLITSIM